MLCVKLVVTEYDGRRQELSGAPVVMEYDNNETEEYPYL